MANLHVNNTDIELSASSNPIPTSSSGREGLLQRSLRALCVWHGTLPWRRCQEVQNDNKGLIQIEDFRKGYPRFSAFMAAHDSFQVFRRFSNLRTRLLLQTQARLALLEKKLNEIDREEVSPLFLASYRMDKNSEREAVITEIHRVLSMYDDLIERNHRSLTFQNPQTRFVRSLQNWLKGNPCITREETEFLGSNHDLLALASPEDNVVSWLERVISASFVYLHKQPRSSISNDIHVHIFPRSFTDRAVRMLLTPIIIFLLLSPVVICNALRSLSARLAVMIAATSIFITILSLFTRSKTIELAVAGATYSTVLVVFMTSPNAQPGS